MSLKHQSAEASHYDFAADKYDAINEKFVEIQNEVIASILKKYQVASVLDLACGTGSQVVYLSQMGMKLCGVDINKKMLQVAKAKCEKLKLDCELSIGDMRTTRAGTFDAVITIFNAIGHLTKADFKKALKNIHANLKPGGVYVFDIFNLNYMLEADNITQLTIDKIAKEKERRIRKIQYSTIDLKGVLASFTISIVQRAGKISHAEGMQTLQIYSADELTKMLEDQGFEFLHKYGIDGSRFSDKKTKHMLLVAKARKKAKP